MCRSAITGRWLKIHRKQLAVHGLVLGAFVLYLLFLAVPLFDRFEAIPGESTPQNLSLPGETNNIKYWIDSIATTKQAIDIAGWAFVEGRSTENTVTYVVMKSKTNTYIFDTSPVWRPGITEHFRDRNLNLDRSGFSAIIPIRKIKSGEYVLGLFIETGEIQALQYVNRSIFKSGGDLRLTYRTSGLQEIALPSESDHIRFGIDSMQEEVMEGREVIHTGVWALNQGQRIKV